MTIVEGRNRLRQMIEDAVAVERKRNAEKRTTTG
jgi:hypothetical protein